MSETIPTLKRGDRVRVMQTSRMEALGLANRRGTYLGSGLVRLNNGHLEFIGDSSLMRVTPEEEATWNANGNHG